MHISGATMKINFKNVLLLSNTGIDMGMPDFRVGSYTGILLPMARTLAKHPEISARILANSHVGQRLKSFAATTGQHVPSILTLDDEMLRANRAQNFMIDSYSNSLDEDKIRCASESILKALGDWVPDVVISWESPTKILRSIFPDALVLDVMPGMFMRPPFPRMFSFDPVGLYKNCWYSEHNPSEIMAPDEYLDNHLALRELYEKHFAELRVAETLNQNVSVANYERATIVPLQISDYFGWRENTAYQSQLDLIEDIQEHTCRDRDIIYTQYIGNLVSEHVINKNNVAYLRNNYPNFVYSDKFERIDNITQYIIPSAESVVSVSSTLGLQAKFFGKRVISPSHSHLSYIADGTRVEELATAGSKSLDGFIANYLGRTNFIADRILSEPGYLIALLNSFRKRKGESSIEQFPDFEEVGNSITAMRAVSSLKRSKDIFQKAYPAPRSQRDIRIASQHRRVHERDIQTVSFDVFDTLVCRTVLRPVDVFELIQARLYETHLDVLGENFIAAFASSRHGIERLIRASLDAQESPISEEIKIADIYKIMLEDYGLSHELIDELVMVEQELELSCLIPRNDGVELYYSALSSGNRVIIISDFIHPTAFVERVLRKCGVDGWHKIYVSSDIGLKKHTGSLFSHVKKDLNLTASETLHIGDNPHGDIKMAELHGWQTRCLPSGPSLVRSQLKKENLDIKTVYSSFVTGAILSALANEFYGFGDVRHVESSEVKMIESTGELGFVALGPMMHFFSKWLVDEAQNNDCTQIAFFARDSVLPFHMVNKLLQQGGASDIRTCYLPVSRSAVSGLDIKAPQDVYKVRIDDFEKSRPLMELFARRFHLDLHEVDVDSVLKWTNKSVRKAKVRDLPTYAIYQIAQTSAQNHLEAYCQRMLDKRIVFERGLRQWGCDINRKTLTVDFGYKGSIHRKVEGFFTEPPLPRFFMSYANALGRAPLPNGKAFFLNNQIPYYKSSSPLMQYNLIIETMVNEGTGSALEYHDVDGHIEVLREASVDEEHTRIIKELHQGALQFSDYWIRNCKSIDDYASIEPQMLSFILRKVLSDPTQEIARMLANLNFDNGYAGHQPRKVIEVQPSGHAEGGLWREGVNVLKKTKAPPGRKKLNKYMKWIAPKAIRLKIMRFFVARFCSERMLTKFDRDPLAFLSESSNKNVRYLARFL